MLNEVAWFGMTSNGGPATPKIAGNFGIAMRLQTK
jgi:hypothetical protein